MSVAAVLFDLDGTLIDSAAEWNAALADLARSRGRELPAHLLDEVHGISTEQAVALLHQALGWTGGDPAGRRAPADAIRADAVPADAIRADAAWVRARVLDRYRDGARWAAGATELIDEIRASGVPVGLVTSNCRQVVRAILGADAPRFDVTVCADDVAAVKPNPEPYRTAADRLGVDPRACLAVEDSPAGVASALAAGCRVVAIGPKVPEIAGLTRVRDLRDLREAGAPY